MHFPNRIGYIGEEILFNDQPKYHYTVKVTSAHATIFVLDKQKFLKRFPRTVLNDIQNYYTTKLKDHSNILRHIIEAKYPHAQIVTESKKKDELPSETINLVLKPSTALSMKIRNGLIKEPDYTKILSTGTKTTSLTPSAKIISVKPSTPISHNTNVKTVSARDYMLSLQKKEKRIKASLERTSEKEPPVEKNKTPKLAIKVAESQPTLKLPIDKVVSGSVSPSKIDSGRGHHKKAASNVIRSKEIDLDLRTWEDYMINLEQSEQNKVSDSSRAGTAINMDFLLFDDNLAKMLKIRKIKAGLETPKGHEFKLPQGKAMSPRLGKLIRKIKLVSTTTDQESIMSKTTRAFDTYPLTNVEDSLLQQQDIEKPLTKGRTPTALPGTRRNWTHSSNDTKTLSSFKDFPTESSIEGDITPFLMATNREGLKVMTTFRGERFQSLQRAEPQKPQTQNGLTTRKVKSINLHGNYILKNISTEPDTSSTPELLTSLEFKPSIVKESMVLKKYKLNKQLKSGSMKAANLLMQIANDLHKYSPVNCAGRLRLDTPSNYHPTPVRKNTRIRITVHK